MNSKFYRPILYQRKHVNASHPSPAIQMQIELAPPVLFTVS